MSSLLQGSDYTSSYHGSIWSCLGLITGLITITWLKVMGLDCDVPICEVFLVKVMKTMGFLLWFYLYNSLTADYFLPFRTSTLNFLP